MRLDVGPMRKFGVTLALIAASFALVASTAEAAKTSEKEGRKFSRKYVKAKVRQGDLQNAGGWNQRDCWRIGPEGAGDYRIFPRGVACVFSTTKRSRGTCGVYGVAVKDGRKRVQASNIDFTQLYRGDPADCEPRAFMDWPSVLGGGIVGDPL
jgi:hypothetical protein